MKLYIDSADLAKDREVMQFYPVEGITTNPKILSGCGAGEDVFLELKQFVREEGIELFVQVTGETAREMTEQALRLREFFGEELVVKIPAVKEGYRAVRICKEEGIRVCVTVVHSVTQAFMAAKAGADFVAPYISHMDNLGGDGVEAVAEMLEIFRKGDYHCQVLGASFRTAEQIRRLAAAGCDAATITPEMFDLLIAHSATDDSMRGFRTAWRDRFGECQVDDLLKEGMPKQNVSRQ